MVKARSDILLRVADDRREEGLILHLGVSNADAAQFAEARAVAPVAAVQNAFHVHATSGAALLEECTRSGTALAALLAASPVLLAIPGTGSLAHLEENVGAASIRLTPRERESIRRDRP